MNESIPSRRVGFLLAAFVCAGIALAAPAGGALAEYPFSARMAQHLIFQLIVPPLILLSFPMRQSAGKFGRLLRHPLLAWFCGLGAMWIWHAPALCNAAVRSPALHVMQELSVLLMGILFWRPIVGPGMSQRLPPLLGCLYLFTACLGCTVMGIVIAFAPSGLYLAASLPGALGEWRFAAPADQRIGGLIMWVPGCFIYIAGIMGLMARWYGAQEPEVFPAGATERIS